MTIDQAPGGQAVVRLLEPELRRRWVRGVLSSPEFTAAHKTVLLALETFADYRDGTNAHPGEANLAEMCALTTRAVRMALSRAQQLGFIERTGKPNSKAGRAAVYRLVLPSTTGTAVPVDSATTGTAVPVDSATTGTAVPVDNSTTGTAVPPRPERLFLHDRNGGSSHPPRPSNHPGVSPNGGTSPAPDFAAAEQTPSRFCEKHPRGTPKRCPDCANARTFFNAWQAAAAEDDIARELATVVETRARQQAIDNCDDCDYLGRRLDAQRADLPDVKCDHRHLKLVAGDA